MQPHATIQPMADSFIGVDFDQSGPAEFMLLDEESTEELSSENTLEDYVSELLHKAGCLY